MTAEEFNKSLPSGKKITRFESVIFDFAEAYHKAKVESISKEDIYSEICQFVRDMDSLTRQPLITHRKVSQRSVNWFKQQLLK